MNNLKQNILDRLIDSFSAAELKKRVWLVAIIGIAICLATALGLYFFLHWPFFVTPDQPAMPYWKLLWMGN